jgi:two-component system, OmpR family, response regulator ChvI
LFSDFDFTKQINILNPDIKMLFLTTLDVIKEIEFVCPNMKESDIVRKPVHPDVLLSKIESMLNS